MLCRGRYFFHAPVKRSLRDGQLSFAAFSVSVFIAAFHVYAAFVLQTGSCPTVRRLPNTEIVEVKSGSALQLFVPGVYANSSPPLVIFISQTPADVPTGSAGA